jgi:hypothetical protein
MSEITTWEQLACALSTEDTAPSEYVNPVGDEYVWENDKLPKVETEEERNERLWRAIVAASQT